MLQYAICEIGGKQYQVEPGKSFNVALASQVFDPEAQTRRGDALEANVLMRVDEGKIQVGKPYLKEKLKFKVLETFKGKKIRVAKYHAKANYRRVRGFRPKLTKVIWDLKKALY